VSVCVSSSFCAKDQDKLSIYYVPRIQLQPAL
jgi:hypothetical protein